MFQSKLVPFPFIIAYISDVSAHYCWPSVDQTNTWDVVRQTDNHYDRTPIQNVTDPNFTCYNRAGGTAPHIYTVQAGDQITFHTDNTLYHIGVLNIYMAKAPDNVMDFDGSGQVWFKIFEITAHTDPTGATYPTYPTLNLPSITFTIPKKLPTGQYLLRPEHIALHDAAYFGGAQFYIACAQLNVTNGGDGTPGPLVSIPGVYTGHEPGILFNAYAYPRPTNYTQPGPAVWSG